MCMHNMIYGCHCTCVKGTFSPCTMWVPGITSGHQTWQPGYLPVKPSQRPLNEYLNICVLDKNLPDEETVRHYLLSEYA